jgi:hypothetical protein
MHSKFDGVFPPLCHNVDPYSLTGMTVCVLLKFSQANRGRYTLLGRNFCVCLLAMYRPSRTAGNNVSYLNLCAKMKQACVV